MDKSSIRWDHGLASLRCVRAAFDIFSPNYPQDDRQVQVIRGVWGFLPFAMEFWAVDLQELVTAPVGNWHPLLVSIASELSGLLATGLPGPDAALSVRLMEGLEPIRSYFPGLWHDVTITLQAREAGRHRVAGSELGCKQDPWAVSKWG
jgi:hypothetical protein